MRSLFLAVGLTVGLVGCPSTSVTPVTDSAKMDASKPDVTVDVKPKPTPTPTPVPTPVNDSCAQACTKMIAVGCAQMSNCAGVLDLVQANRIIRNPKTSNALSCNDLLSVTSSSDVASNGWNCVVSQVKK